MIKEYSDKVDEIDSLISEGDWEGAGGIVGGFIVQKGIERLGGNKRNPNRDNDNPQNNALESLSRAQKRNLETLDNIVDNHLTDMDFSGTLRDLQGDPVPKPGGGYWNHLQEMKDSYKGLRKIKRGLEGSLQNPNLPQDTRKVLETALDKASVNLKKIEDLFEPFGGLDND
ncbi:polymorphic toxin type 28 domain-containing protein [Brevibacillus sp. HB2.2]|uniref:polymorphic toxin type 28 domain-containing protein n=1 Tax=Brevibacillus sp. HB2.2 TaxID=2738846 RepID=UPI0020C45AFB|nr:polymorphic toxin type 28 domain-containing protein [Brevibacillus sp. HB2.2]